MSCTYVLVWILVTGQGVCQLTCPAHLGSQGLPCEVEELLDGKT